MQYDVNRAWQKSTCPIRTALQLWINEIDEEEKPNSTKINLIVEIDYYKLASGAPSNIYTNIGKINYEQCPMLPSILTIVLY